MNRTRTRKISVPLALVAAVLAAPGLSGLRTADAARGKTKARIQELPPLAGFNETYANDINEKSVAVGNSTLVEGENTPVVRPVFWRRGQVQPLPLPEGSPYGWAFGIDDKGRMVGESGPTPETARATFWQNGQGSLLPGLTETGASYGSDINNRGQIGGSARNEAGHWRAILWQNGRIVKQYDPLPGDDNCTWSVIDSDGHGCGDSFSVSAEGNEIDRHAVLYRNGVTFALPEPEGAIGSRAFCINDRDQVVGYFVDADGNVHGAVWEKGNLRDLGIPEGATGSTADANNDRGQLIGTVGISDTEFLTGLWTRKGFTSLNDQLPTDSGWTNLIPYILSNRGQLVGQGILNGTPRGFILTLPKKK